MHKIFDLIPVDGKLVIRCDGWWFVEVYEEEHDIDPLASYNHPELSTAMDMCADQLDEATE